MSCVSFKGSAGLFDNFNFSRTVTVNEIKLLLVRSTIAIQKMFWIAICIKSSRLDISQNLEINLRSFLLLTLRSSWHPDNK